MNIKEPVEKFLETRQPSERYASFDYCYYHFYSAFKEKRTDRLASPRNVQNSCNQLGFYLASWGMMRGSSFLLGKSAKFHQPLIERIAEMPTSFWEIDVDSYTNENIDLLLECKEQITDCLGRNNNPSDTLVTKIMLGVFGNIPAFDQYFRKALGVHTVNKKSLLKVKEFYQENKEDFDSYHIKTIDFKTGNPTRIVYPKAKLVDMAGFVLGQ